MLLPGIGGCIAVRQSAAPVTWNPSDKSAGMTLSAANTVATAGTNANIYVRATKAQSSGKLYFEIALNALGTPGTNYLSVGVSDASSALTNILGFDTHSGGFSDDGGTTCHLYYNTFTSVTSAGVLGVSEIISVAVDVSSHLLYVARNNTWLNSANPGSGTGGVNYVTTSPVYPTFVSNSGTVNSVTLRAASANFTYTPPTGFSAWQS